MDSLITYFETIPSIHRALMLVGGIVIFWILEGMLPFLVHRYKKVKHALPNLFFTVTTVVVNLPLAFLLLFASDWVSSQHFGLINWLPELPLWLDVIIALLFLDFIGAYIAHLIEHKVKFLWKVHLVHHSDHHVDVTTANRHHPFESLIRYVFTLLAIFLVGAPIGVVMLYQSLSVIFSQFNHANIKLPQKVDTIISLVLVSPDMHKVHHHYKLPYTDKNYGNIFSIWDRLFGTYITYGREKIIYGVDTFFNEYENSKICTLLKQPFQEHKEPTEIEKE